MIWSLIKPLEVKLQMTQGHRRRVILVGLNHSDDMHYLANIVFLKIEFGCFYLSMHSPSPITLYLAFTYLFAQPLNVFDFDICDNPLKLWK